MKCFEIKINGKKICTAGVGDEGVLTAIVSLFMRKEASAETTEEARGDSYSESLELRVGGLANRQLGITEQLEWLNQDLAIGDEVVIRIIEAASCDELESKEVSYLECSFCNKKQAEVVKLIAGPAVYICDECVADCSEALANDEPRGVITMVLSKTAETGCSFCGQKPIEVERIVGVPTARICNQCTKICGDILARDV